MKHCTRSALIGLCHGFVAATLLVACSNGSTATPADGAAGDTAPPDGGGGDRETSAPDTGVPPQDGGKDGGQDSGRDATADSGDVARDTGASDTAGDGAPPDGPANDNTPIVDRTSRATFTCRADRMKTDHAPRYWQSFPALIATGTGIQFLRHEAMTTNPIFPTQSRLSLGTLSPAGVFGTTAVIAGAATDVRAMGAAARGDGFAAVWLEPAAPNPQRETATLRFAAFDGAGQVVIAPKTVATSVDPEVAPKLATAGAGTGFGVVYGVAVGASSRDVVFVALDNDGTAKATPRRIDQLANGLGFVPLPGLAIAGGPTGYGITWRAIGEARGAVEFTKAGLDGAEIIPRRRVSVTNDARVTVVGGSGFDYPSTALVEASGGYLAAWPEARQGMDFDSGASSTIYLARLDAQGVRQGMPVPMRAATDSVDEVEPSLVSFAPGAVAVLWGRGSHIYICAGCVPDTRLDLLLVDPATLTPLSNVVTVTNGGTAGGPARGGLLRRQVAVQSASLLATFDLQFHVHHTSASAAFSCAP